MGEIKKLAERQKQIESVSSSVSSSVDKLSSTESKITHNRELRVGKEVLDKLSASVDGTNLTTSTTSDNGTHEKSAVSKGVDIFLDAREVKLQKLKHDAKKDLKQRDNELKNIEKDIDESKLKMENTRARANANDKFTDAQKKYYTEVSYRAEEKLETQEREVEELREKISEARNHKKSRAEHKKSSSDTAKTDDRFNPRDKSLKESSKDMKASDKLEKLGDHNDKLNTKNSLKKIRGGSEKIKEKAVKKTKEKIVKKEKKKLVKKGGKLIGKKAKNQAAKAVAKAAAKKAAAAAASAAGGVITAAVLIIVIIILLALVLMMVLTVLAGKNVKDCSVQNISYSSSAEQKIIYNKLKEHFGDNENAILGIMCNIQYESSFYANNLEEVNNENWGVSDPEYTEKVNRGFNAEEGTEDVVTKEDFIKSTYMGSTDGHYEGTYWKNPNGGYGYCQYTDYNEKKRFYEYAANWFSDDGEGKGKSFDISDPDMQASYIVYMLENYIQHIDTALKSATNLEDAVYIWCSEYERPDGDYREKAVERSAAADAIMYVCSGEADNDDDDVVAREAGGTDYSALDGTYIFQVESGPCVTCAIANMIKRYCFTAEDEQWDEIVPGLITGEGASLVDAIDDESGATCGWGCYDANDRPHLEVVASDWYPFDGDKTITIHGIECKMHNVYGSLTQDELKDMLATHPEGIVVTASYENGSRAHGKLITRFDEETNSFYCIDPGMWGSSLPGKNGGSEYSMDFYADGRREVPLSSSQCWQRMENVLQYRYIEH